MGVRTIGLVEMMDNQGPGPPGVVLCQVAERQRNIPSFQESYAKPRKIFAVKNVCNLQETRYSKEGRDAIASPSNPVPWLKQFAYILQITILSSEPLFIV